MMAASLQMARPGSSSSDPVNLIVARPEKRGSEAEVNSPHKVQKPSHPLTFYRPKPPAQEADSRSSSLQKEVDSRSSSLQKEVDGVLVVTPQKKTVTHPEIPPILKLTKPEEMEKFLSSEKLTLFLRNICWNDPNQIAQARKLFGEMSAESLRVLMKELRGEFYLSSPDVRLRAIQSHFDNYQRMMKEKNPEILTKLGLISESRKHLKEMREKAKEKKETIQKEYDEKLKIAQDEFNKRYKAIQTEHEEKQKLVQTEIDQKTENLQKREAEIPSNAYSTLDPMSLLD